MVDPEPGQKHPMDVIVEAQAAEYSRLLAVNPPAPPDGVYRFRPGDQPLPTEGTGPSRSWPETS